MAFIGIARMVGGVARKILSLGAMKEDGFDFIIGTVVILLFLYLSLYVF